MSGGHKKNKEQKSQKKIIQLSAINHLIQNISNPTMYDSHGGEGNGSSSS